MAFPASDENIDAAENALGLSFPNALRGRFLRDNGGEIAVEDWPGLWRLFPVRDDTDRERLRRTAEDVVRENEALNDLRQTGELPAHVVAVAENGGGDLLVLDDRGAFAVWDHETAELDPVRVDWAPDA